MIPLSAAARIVLVLAGLLFAPYVSAQTDDYQEAAKLFRSGQHAQALERVDGFLKNNPKDARARFLKGLILTEQNKQADAIKIFTSLTDDYPELPEPHNNLAVLYASQGQYDKARAALEMAIRTHPSYATAHENLGDIYAKMASQAYDKALQLDKSNAAAQIKLGLIKELFSSNPLGTKPPANKSDTTAKPTPIASAKPPVTKSEAAQSAAPVAAQPTTTKPVAGDDAGEAIKAVNSWAKAWSENDVDSYLGFYAPSFQPPAGEPRSDWEAARRLRVAKPKKIDVQVEAPKAKLTDSGRVAVTFRQSYRSPSLKVASTKTLIMVKAGNRWLIEQERIGG